MPWARKKAFCGWACPIGFLGEIAARLDWMGTEEATTRSAPGTNAAKLLRYAVLAVSLFFTYRMGELVLRGYDPFFRIFSGFGHGSVGPLSLAVPAATILGTRPVPMFFCRYLCPMGAVFDPFSRIGLLRVTRDASSALHADAAAGPACMISRYSNSGICGVTGLH